MGHVGRGISYHVQEGVRLEVFSLTFSEQRLQLPSKAGEGGAGGLDSAVRKEGAGACVHVRSGFIPGVCFIKTRSSGSASGTCFGQEEEKQKNRIELSPTNDG